MTDASDVPLVVELVLAWSDYVYIIYIIYPQKHHAVIGKFLFPITAWCFWGYDFIIPSIHRKGDIAMMTKKTKTTYCITLICLLLVVAVFVAYNANHLPRNELMCDDKVVRLLQ